MLSLGLVCLWPCEHALLPEDVERCGHAGPERLFEGRANGHICVARLLFRFHRFRLPYCVLNSVQHGLLVFFFLYHHFAGFDLLHNLIIVFRLDGGARSGSGRLF